MEIGLGQCEKFAKSARVPGNPQNLARWTMPPQAASAPVAFSARQIDLAHHAPAQQIRIVRRHDFPDELMARRSGKAVITAKQLQIRIADSGVQEFNHRVAFAAPRTRRLTDGRAVFFEVDRNHVV